MLDPNLIKCYYCFKIKEDICIIKYTEQYVIECCGATQQIFETDNKINSYIIVVSDKYEIASLLSLNKTSFFDCEHQILNTFDIIVKANSPEEHIRKLLKLRLLA